MGPGDSYGSRLLGVARKILGRTNRCGRRSLEAGRGCPRCGETRNRAPTLGLPNFLELRYDEVRSAPKPRSGGPNLGGADLSGAYLGEAHLSFARDISNEELEQQARSLEGATMPNSQKYEDRIEDKEGREEDGENG